MVRRTIIPLLITFCAFYSIFAQKEIELFYEPLLTSQIASVPKPPQQTSSNVAAIFIFGQDDVRKLGEKTLPTLLSYESGVETSVDWCVSNDLKVRSSGWGISFAAQVEGIDTADVVTRYTYRSTPSLEISLLVENQIWNSSKEFVSNIYRANFGAAEPRSSAAFDVKL
ncbi:MAG: hypothetical protein AAF720_11445 [Pseudomonadota bacterium]